eukprot:CAMPEP_0171118346 /NCGR_PEP_ID=MMETSP0766_2-20121228/94536_1 /TAXON_ID=439317 /ORGANISM="Gambierdiscus australes, Strain CAWD 149" /LENGTH=94 /DNA_ID=CAMNT_0011580921 /DNA_START=138 /DNA_END=419 /DNA_ORIENTATION=+
MACHEKTIQEALALDRSPNPMANARDPTAASATATSPAPARRAATTGARESSPTTDETFMIAPAAVATKTATSEARSSTRTADTTQEDAATHTA